MDVNFSEASQGFCLYMNNVEVCKGTQSIYHSFIVQCFLRMLHKAVGLNHNISSFERNLSFFLPGHSIKIMS